MVHSRALAFETTIGKPLLFGSRIPYTMKQTLAMNSKNKKLDEIPLTSIV
tara:strand:- start:204 stop:353 length:150 start_codon:yes stop_codon:yes gene_type:complete